LADDIDAGRLASERRLAIATHAARIGIWDWNLSDNSFVYSRLAREIFGLPRDEPVTLEAIRALTHPEDLPWTSAMARRATDPRLREQEPYRYRIIRPDTGEERWILGHGEATFETVGGVEKATRYTGTIQDITEQKRADDALIESEARLRLALEAGQMAVWELDVDTQTIAHSPQLNALCGFPPEANPTPADFRARYAPGERERIEREGQAVLQRGERQIQTEFKMIWPDGTQKWMLLRAAYAPGSPDRGQRVIGVLMDVTERHATEERIRTVAEELQHRLKNSLTIVQTIATQTFRDRQEVDGVDSFLGRLRALAAATDIVTLNDWSSAEISQVVAEITQPFRDERGDSFLIEGDRFHLPSKVAIGLGMALHELCTNAAKYGALSIPGGRVNVAWSNEMGLLNFEWREQGGPPVMVPERRGFGSRLLERGAFGEPDGRVDIDYHPEGLTARITARL
jgi:PAS domain S-box-containing protein